MSNNSREILTLAEKMYSEAEKIIASPLAARFAGSGEKFRPLAETLRRVLDFHYGFENELPLLMTKVDRVFETLQESAPGRWHVRREIDGKNGMLVFQERVAALAKYIRDN